MREITVDPELVAYCGLYCGACGSYRKGQCPGCHENTKAGWCAIKPCSIEHEYATCADCEEFTDPNSCRKFNNLFGRIVGFVLNSNRQACVYKIRELGLEEYAAYMAGRERVSVPRRGD